MKKFVINSYYLVKRGFSLLGCLFGKHDWEYLYGNYHSQKDVFQCNNCKKKIEE